LKSRNFTFLFNYVLGREPLLGVSPRFDSVIKDIDYFEDSSLLEKEEVSDSNSYSFDSSFTMFCNYFIYYGVIGVIASSKDDLD
jgi:hypothetical protein